MSGISVFIELLTASFTPKVKMNVAARVAIHDFHDEIVLLGAIVADPQQDADIRYLSKVLIRVPKLRHHDEAKNRWPAISDKLCICSFN